MKKRELDARLIGLTEALCGYDNRAHEYGEFADDFLAGYDDGMLARKKIIAAAREQQTQLSQAERTPEPGRCHRLPTSPSGTLDVTQAEPSQRSGGSTPSAETSRPGEQQTREQEPARGKRITHGRHCICSSCAAEDWTNPRLAPCGMHGPSCPAEYEPLGRPGDPVPAQEPVEERVREKTGELHRVLTKPALDVLARQNAEREASYYRDRALEAEARTERAERERDRYDDEAERLGILSEEHRTRAEAAEHERDELRAAIERHRSFVEPRYAEQIDVELWAVLSKEEDG